jgi:hypothetical protein
MPVGKTESHEPNDVLDTLDDLIDRYYRKLLNDIKINIKPGDFIKMIELRNKLAPKGEDQQRFWAMLSRIRREVQKSEHSRSNTKNKVNNRK